VVQNFDYDFLTKKKTKTHHSIHGQQLIASSQATVLVGHSTRYNARNVNRGMLLTAAHHVEAQALGCLWQLDNARVRVTLRGCERRHSCL
jgi:hypothetical protein